MITDSLLLEGSSLISNFPKIPSDLKTVKRFYSELAKPYKASEFTNSNIKPLTLLFFLRTKNNAANPKEIAKPIKLN